MTEPRRELPDFESPPVTETALGVQFSPLVKLSIPNMALYWAVIRGSYPLCETQPPLSPVVEEFGDRKFLQVEPRLEMVTEPTVRFWFMNGARTELIQLQKDRFIHNWRKVRGDEVYPRYRRLRPSFETEWEGFREFLGREQLGVPEVNQCELTYVNHFEVGRGFDAYGEVHRVITPWSGRYSGEFLREPESVGLTASFLMPDKKGRLHIALQPAIRRSDAHEILQINLVARGRPASSRTADILDWFEVGHEWIVRGFTDLTTPDMHRVWGRKA